MIRAVIADLLRWLGFVSTPATEAACRLCGEETRAARDPRPTLCRRCQWEFGE